MGSDCIFCEIYSGEIPSEILYRDELCFVVRDIQPSAPSHLLVIPIDHVTYLDEISDDAFDIVAQRFRVAVKIAAEEGISQSGYRLVVNQRDDSGQIIPHLHLHVVGGDNLGRIG